MQAADDDGFDAFVQDTSARMMTAARLLTGSSQLTEDLVQEAYTRTYARWPQVRDGQPYAYARKVMLNRHLDWWRRPWRELPRSEVDTGSAPGDHAVQLASSDQVRRALAGLTRKERSVIVLRYFEDASEAEIAEALGIAPGTVKSTANRASGKMPSSGHFPLGGRGARDE